LEKIPLVILVVISSGLTYYAQKHGGAVKSLEYIPMADRVANALVSYILYIGKMIYPVKLALLYPHPETLPWRQVLSASLILLFVSSLVAIAIKKHRYLIVGWLWYLGTLVPVIGLVQVGGQALADRYTYVPLIGLFIMIAWGVPEFLKQWKFRKLFLWACSLFLILISAGLSWKQTGFWKNSTVLFEHAAKVTKNNFTMYYNFGNAMAEKGRDDAAKEYYLKALAVKPDSLITNYNLGNLYFKEKNTDAAIEQYLKVLALNPNYSNAQYNLGIALDVQGRPQEALPYLLAALKGMPDNADAFFKTANALIQTGKIDDAIWHYKQALRINPYFVNAHCNLGVALFRKGDVPGSIDAFNETLRLQPDLKSAQLYLRKAMSVQSKKH
jgi:tetratricopeptide (TPR) repeat protein